MPHDSTADQASLAALARVAAQIHQIEDPDRLLEAVLHSALEALEAERGFLLLEGPGGALDVRASHNLSEQQLGEVARVSTSVVQEVLRTGEPVLLYETGADRRFAHTESIVLQRIQSVACVPLRLRARQVGAIYLDSVQRRERFTRASLPFLTAFAELAAVALENARRGQSLREENRRLRSEVTRAHGFEGIVGHSPAMREVFETMTRVLDTDATVLVTGESGTGKELVARALHYNGDRAARPFVALFCGSLPDELLESELFGHKKGAFTGAATDKPGLFEAADGGTVFLDEVGDLSPKLQTALLRVLQTGEVKRVGETHTRTVDVRIVAATNKPLRDEIAAGRFREDLLYRLNTIEIELPPLRRRPADVELLAYHFLERYAVGRRARVEGFAAAALDALRRYPWPGNVRELENAVERAVVLCRGAEVAVEDLRLPGTLPEDRPAAAGYPPDCPLKEVERQHVLAALAHHDGNVSETARVLGVSRRWLHYRLNDWQGDEPDPADA